MSLSALITTLLDFERAPGRFPLARREPALLFEQTHTVLLLASGRAVEGLDALADAAQEQARRAARFFVRVALLRLGADPYTLLGLGRTADADTVRAHYRMMIRLTHPDFSGGDSEWPADAATRINLANDLLSSPSQRADLDSALAKAEASASAPRPRGVVPGAASNDRLTHPLGSHSRYTARPNAAGASRKFEFTPQMKMAGLALGAMLAVFGLLAVNPSSEDRSLVARGLNDDKARTQTSLLQPSAKQTDKVSSLRLESEDATTASPPGSTDRSLVSLKLSTEFDALSSQPEAVPLRVSTQAPRAVPTRVEKPLERPPRKPPSDAVFPTATIAKATVTQVEPNVADAAPANAPPPEPDPTLASSSSPPVAAVETSAEPSGVLAMKPSAPSLVDVQPLVARIERVAQLGLGIPLARLIHPNNRTTPATQKFVFDFQDALAGYRVAGIARTDVVSREVGDQLDVDLRMHFNLEDVHGSSQSRQVGMRARFGKVGDNVALVRMTLIPQSGGR